MTETQRGENAAAYTAAYVNRLKQVYGDDWSTVLSAIGRTDRVPSENRATSKPVNPFAETVRRFK